ncbi:MAG: energy-coupling factor transporter transmembrane component T family protein [Mycoplasma sp.]
MKVKQPIHPIIGILFSLAISVFALFYANAFTMFIIVAAIVFLFICLGYWKACIAWLISAAIIAGGIGGIVYSYSNDMNQMILTFAKSATMTIAVIPGLGLSTTYLTRAMETLKIPRPITLGVLITFSFFPVLMKEIRNIREAMRTRGANNLLNFKIFYRAFFIPLMIRIIHISDTLSLSIETRGFSMEKKPYTSFQKITFTWKDVVFSTGFILTIVLGVIYAI